MTFLNFSYEGPSVAFISLLDSVSTENACLVHLILLIDPNFVFVLTDAVFARIVLSYQLGFRTLIPMLGSKNLYICDD